MQWVRRGLVWRTNGGGGWWGKGYDDKPVGEGSRGHLLPPLAVVWRGHTHDGDLSVCALRKEAQGGLELDGAPNRGLLPSTLAHKHGPLCRVCLGLLQQAGQGHTYKGSAHLVTTQAVPA